MGVKYCPVCLRMFARIWSGILLTNKHFGCFGQDTPLDIVEDKDIYGEEIHAILLEATQNWIAASDAKHQSSTSENRKDGRSTPLETERARRRAERERLDYGARQQEQQKQQPNKDNDEHDWFADKPSI